MNDFSIEETLDEIAVVSKRVSKLSKELVSTSRSLEQAAAKGDLNKLKSAAERLANLRNQIDAETESLTKSWLMNDAAVDSALETKLMDEVSGLLKRQGISVHRYGSGWSASLLMLRVESKSRSVKLDRSRLPTVRPSLIAAAVTDPRHRPSTRPEQFVETLYLAYRFAVGSNSLSNQPMRIGSSVPLSEVYKALTLHPETRREYSIESFTRDLYVLDQSGLSNTKDGMRMFCSASTSSKGGGGVLTVLDDNGAPHNYFAVAFREVE